MEGAAEPSTPIGGSEPATPNGSERNLSEQHEEQERGREEYLVGVQRRIESYENCVAAITAATTSLQELSGHLDAMQRATQQLNTFTGEQENGDDRPKRTWNSSTKLTQPRRKATSTSQTRERQTHNPTRQDQNGRGKVQIPRQTRNSANEQADDEQQALTRELLERAVSTAFGGLLQDSTLDATAFPDDRDSQSSEISSVRDKENTPQVNSPATKNDAKFRATLEKSASLSANHRQRRREHVDALQQAMTDTRATREFQRRMKHASFEHRERKMAVQALQTRIQQEIQFLSATAADLEKREFLLDDAFESYECALRLELGLADNLCSSSNQQQVEASPRPSY